MFLFLSPCIGEGSPSQYSTAIDSNKLSLNASEWVLSLCERLNLVRDLASLSGRKAKDKRLVQMNVGAKTRTFSVGDLVMYRTPGLNSKMHDSWEGPYQVQEVCGLVNYKIGKTDKKTGGKFVHVNLLKKFHKVHDVCRLDVVMSDECEGNRNKLSGVCEEFNQEELDSVLHDFRYVFSDEPGLCTECVMDINTGSALPISRPPYSIPVDIREKVRKEIEGMEKAGYIERSMSPWASGVVPVRKPDGNVRVCIDYRNLNEVTIPDPYYIPLLDEAVAIVGSSRCLSKLDLTKGFYQVEVAEKDRHKTTFICPFGKFQFRRMPCGLRNAPAMFQRLVEHVLKGFEEFTIAYINDILIASKCWQDH